MTTNINFQHITFRIDLPKESLDALKEMLARYGTCIITHEDAKKSGKSHFHGYLLTKEDKDYLPSFRIKLVRTFKVSKAQYSITRVKDLTKYVAYIIKDGDVCFNNVFSETEMVSFQEYDMSVKTAFQEAIKKSKTKQLTSSQKLIKNYVPYDFDQLTDEQRNMKKFVVRDHIISYLENGMSAEWRMFNPNSIAHMYFTIQYKYYNNNTDFRVKLIEIIRRNSF